MSNNKTTLNQNTGPEPPQSRPSFGCEVLVFYAVILMLPVIINAWWIKWLASTLFLILFCFTLWGMLSKGEFEKMRKSYPAYTRGEYIGNILIYYFILPLLFFGIVGIFLYFKR